MAAKKYGFENLVVYQLAEELSDVVWDIVNRWRVLASDTVGKQLIRSADRVGADIAEGTGRGSAKDNRRFVDDAGAVRYMKPVTGSGAPIAGTCLSQRT